MNKEVKMSNYNHKIIRDPLYGFIGINELEEKIIKTSTFQRLNRIKQLSTTFLVYPSANHTRYEHSLGTLHLANLVAMKFNLKENLDDLRLASLLHDIGHGPFSHVFETAMKWVNGDNYKHEMVTEHLIRNDTEINKILGDKTEDVLDILLNIKNPLHNIISSDFDIDKMDYFRRDSYHLGVAYGVYDFDRLIHTITMVEDPKTKDKYFGITEKGIRSYESFRLARFNLWEQVYEHHTRLIADDMLIRALKSAFEEEVIDEDKLNLEKSDKLEFTKYYNSLDDHSIQHEILSKSKGKAKYIVKNIRNRKLFKRCYRIKINQLNIPDVFRRQRLMKADLEGLKEFEKEISDKSAVDPDDLIIHIQNSPIKGYYKSDDDPELKEILLIKMDNGETHQFDSESPLTITFDTIRRLYVFCNDKIDKIKVCKSCEEIFGTSSDYRPK